MPNAMTIKLVLTILTLFTLTWVTGQTNLVPNPSFEDTVSCPPSLSSMDQAQYWSSYRNTADYFNTCATVQAGVPNNFFGYQLPNSGNAYAGVYCYDPSGNYREFIGVPLTQTLNIGVKYFLSVYINRADFHSWSSDHFGFKFSTVQYDYFTNPAPIFNSANYYSSNIVTDSVGWTKISGSFIADSLYKYLVLGALFDSAQTNIIIGWYPNDASYYYIDDVCVSTDSLICSQSVGIKDIVQSTNIKIYPNPTSDQSTLQFDNTKKEICTLTLYDHYGQIIRTINNIKSDTVTIQKNDLTSGLYYLVLRTGDRVIVTGKLVVE